MPPIFTPLGDHKNDFITIDDEVNWAVIPVGAIEGFDIELPIRLRLGDQHFGHKHINQRHGKWLKKNRKTACEMIWAKLSTNKGKFFKTEKDNRIVLYIRISPTAYLVLEQQYVKSENLHFLSVVTLYPRDPKEYDEEIGIYESAKFRNQNIKVFIPG